MKMTFEEIERTVEGCKRVTLGKIAQLEAENVRLQKVNGILSRLLAGDQNETSEPLRSDPPDMKRLCNRIDELALSVRSFTCLQNAHVEYLGELVQLAETDLNRQKNFGRVSLKEVKNLLAEIGLSLNMRGRTIMLFNKWLLSKLSAKSPIF